MKAAGELTDPTTGVPDRGVSSPFVSMRALPAAASRSSILTSSDLTSSILTSSPLTTTVSTVVFASPSSDEPAFELAAFFSLCSFSSRPFFLFASCSAASFSSKCRIARRNLGRARSSAIAGDRWKVVIRLVTGGRSSASWSGSVRAASSSVYWNRMAWFCSAAIRQQSTNAPCDFNRPVPRRERT